MLKHDYVWLYLSEAGQIVKKISTTESFISIVKA